jgi:hypothetical protein
MRDERLRGAERRRLVVDGFKSSIVEETKGSEGSDYARAVHQLIAVEVQGPPVVLP